MTRFLAILGLALLPSVAPAETLICAGPPFDAPGVANIVEELTPVLDA